MSQQSYFSTIYPHNQPNHSVTHSFHPITRVDHHHPKPVHICCRESGQHAPRHRQCVTIDGCEKNATEPFFYFSWVVCPIFPLATMASVTVGIDKGEAIVSLSLPCDVAMDCGDAVRLLSRCSIVRQKGVTHDGQSPSARSTHFWIFVFVCSLQERPLVVSNVRSLVFVYNFCVACRDDRQYFYVTHEAVLIVMSCKVTDSCTYTT